MYLCASFILLLPSFRFFYPQSSRIDLAWASVFGFWLCSKEYWDFRLDEDNPN